MVDIDKTDGLYRLLKALKVYNIETEYKFFINNGISDAKSLNNYLLSQLGLDYLGEIDESKFEDVLPYFSDLKNVKKFTSKQLSNMLNQYSESRDKGLKQDIINANLKDVLLLACAYKMRHTDINLNDLVQTCNMGLIEAIDRFDANSRIKFDTYLNYWVLKAITNEFTIGE